ncbi:MAG TPA: dihydroorotase family protein [bacterium]|nr:dihydroorotase family protein [bacterium]
MIDLAVRGAVVVGPRGRYRADLHVAGGKIVALGTLEAQARAVVDAGGLLAIPGVVDSHVHFMDPGETEREDFITGSAAAAVGGVTTVVEHTHAAPVRTAAELRRKTSHLARRSLVDFALAAHVWPELVPQLGELWAAGPAYLKIFTCETHGVPAVPAGPLLRALRDAARWDGVVLAHCEDDAITRDRAELLRAAGRTDGGVIPEWRAREAEAVAVDEVTALARLTGARVVIAHTSHAPIVDLIAAARAAGARVWTESCPQYFYLEERDVVEHGPFRKFTPPARIRNAEDAEAMWRCLASGAITHVSTDHAPATRAQKQTGDIWACPFGLPGVETTLPLMLTAAAAGRVTLERVVDVLCEQPARLYGFYPRKGTLAPGADADIALIDPGRRRRLADAEIVSKAGWTPYAGREVIGSPVMTFVRGRLVARDGRPVGEPGWGRWLPGGGAQEVRS